MKYFPQILLRNLVFVSILHRPKNGPSNANNYCLSNISGSVDGLFIVASVHKSDGYFVKYTNIVKDRAYVTIKPKSSIIKNEDMKEIFTRLHLKKDTVAFMENNIKQVMDYTWETINPALENMSVLFDLARLVDAEECREIHIDKDGLLSFGKECFAVWNADHRCADCTSFKACHMHHKSSRSEYFNGQKYDIQSVPIRLTLSDGTIYSCNMELINFQKADVKNLSAGELPKDELETRDYLTTHDTLTGLLNWDGFCRHTRQLIMSDPDKPRLIISANIRNFKLINSLFGRDKGDEILIEFSRLLLTLCEKDGVCGRSANDIFAICIPRDIYREDHLLDSTVQLKELLDSSSYRLFIHFGVFAITNPNQPISIMFDRSYMALQSIRNKHDRTIAWFDDSMLHAALHEQGIISNFEHNLENGQFVIYLQPQVNPSGYIEGAECLVRWILPDGKMVPPFQFIGILEQSDLIATLDRHVWELAVKQLDWWKDTEFKDVYLSVNVSPRDFYYMDVADTITYLCQKYDVPPKMLHVEITETAIADEMQNNKATISMLQQNGFKVEIDDFGKGSSSLSLLKDIKADVLKIDMGFLRESENNARGAIIIRAVIDLAGKLGMEVITEGVETETQLKNLTEYGCDMFQGYYFSKPIPVADFENLVKKNRQEA